MADDQGFLIEMRVQLAPADGERWEAQRSLVRSVGAAFDARTKAWWLLIGDLNEALTAMGTLASAAETYGTAVTLRLVAAPPTWVGPTVQPEALEGAASS
ncbi:hypothetical protein AB0J85_15900 [Micromonospora echinofusca]|uniref:hypothetical protein n=1 Tax=Micromonospora echinofusca TaxID=47858 RepID=UPI00342BD160